MSEKKEKNIKKNDSKKKVEKVKAEKEISIADKSSFFMLILN